MRMPRMKDNRFFQPSTISGAHKHGPRPGLAEEEQGGGRCPAGARVFPLWGCRAFYRAPPALEPGMRQLQPSQDACSWLDQLPSAHENATRSQATSAPIPRKRMHSEAAVLSRKKEVQ
jgi:hypothetical protein